MLPSDYKRKYKFKTDTGKEQKILNIVIVASIFFVLIWWFFKG